jgi:hypothetical protein
MKKDPRSPSVDEIIDNFTGYVADDVADAREAYDAWRAALAILGPGSPVTIQRRAMYRAAARRAEVTP